MLFVVATGLVALASLALPRLLSVAVFAIDLVVVYQVVLNRTEWIASIPVAHAQYSTFLSDAWDTIWERRQTGDDDVTRLADFRGILTATIARVEGRPAPTSDWNQLRTDSLDLMRLQVAILDGNKAGTTKEEIDRRWQDIKDEWWT